MASKDQLRLFDAPKIAMRPRVVAAAVDEQIQQLAGSLPSNLRLGATNFTTRRWEGHVWRQPVHRAVLAREGLPAYAQHPLLRTVLIGRGGGVRATTQNLRRLASIAPDDFRFVLAADELPLWGHLPRHPRFGPHAGQPNPRFFDPVAMTEHSVQPFVEGLAAHAGVLLICIPNQPPLHLGTRRAFPDRLHAFLRQLPTGPRYAVQLRDHKLLTSAYVAAIRDCNALHCISIDPSMSAVEEQVGLTQPLEFDTVVVRWSMREHFDYRAAVRNFAPYDTIVERDDRARGALLPLLRNALNASRETYVLVDNMAEGCAPATIVELAESLADR